VEKATQLEDTTERLLVNNQRVIVKEVSVATFEQLDPFKVPFVLINAMVCTLHTNLLYIWVLFLIFYV